MGVCKKLCHINNVLAWSLSLSNLLKSTTFNMHFVPKNDWTMPAPIVFCSFRCATLSRWMLRSHLDVLADKVVNAT